MAAILRRTGPLKSMMGENYLTLEELFRELSKNTHQYVTEYVTHHKSNLFQIWPPSRKTKFKIAFHKFS